MGDTPLARSKRSDVDVMNFPAKLAEALQNVRVLRASLADAEGMLAASRAEELRLRVAHDALSEQCATLRAQVIDLEASLGRRTREIAQLRAALDDPAQAGADRALIRALQGELASIRAEIGAVALREQHQSAMTEMLRLQLAAAEARGAELAMRANAMAAEARARDAQLAAANAEIAALTDRNAVLERERAALGATVAAARAEMTSDSRRVTFEDALLASPSKPRVVADKARAAWPAGEERDPFVPLPPAPQSNTQSRGGRAAQPPPAAAKVPTVPIAPRGDAAKASKEIAGIKLRLDEIKESNRELLEILASRPRPA